MNEKIVTSQAELDAIPGDYNGRIIIKFGTPYNRAVVNKRYAYSVEALGNSQIVDAARRSNVKVSGNARVVYNPDSITAWADGNDIPIIDGKIMLYKAVHKRDTEYVSDWDASFFYEIGEMAVATCRR